MAQSKERQATTRTSAKIYHLEVALNGIKPRIWRRLQVSGDASLGWLHAVIQVAMGWTNSHLHQFIVGERVCSDPAFNLDQDGEGQPILDENKVTLMKVAPRQKDVFLYEYDFGDSWNHRVTVKKILASDPGAAKVALCLDGASACPPEDCGGVGGYEDLLQVIRDPRHEEHESMLEWLGGSFDPKAFDRERINKSLQKLKWPRTTVDQLAKVLMQRDGIRG